MPRSIVRESLRKFVVAFVSTELATELETYGLTAKDFADAIDDEDSMHTQNIINTMEYTMENVLSELLSADDEEDEEEDEEDSNQEISVIDITPRK